jgi:hypothetical protein
MIVMSKLSRAPVRAGRGHPDRPIYCNESSTSWLVWVVSQAFHAPIRNGAMGLGGLCIAIASCKKRREEPPNGRQSIP